MILRKVRAVLASLAAGVVLVGCGLPRTSEVREGNALGPAPQPPVRVQFEGPQRGASAQAVVRGFLAAGWAGQDDYRTARSYLTPEASRAWNPRASVSVYESGADLQVGTLTDGRMRIVARETGRLDADGRYAARPSTSTRSASIRLTRRDGEWRIAELDPGFGVWLTRPFFESAYRPFDIAYTGTDDAAVVVDRRWFAAGSGLPTTLARAMLGPVPAYLADAVTTGFPVGTSLAVDAVPIVGTTAEVDLSASMLEASTDDRRRAWAQALVTMVQVPAVGHALLRVADRDLDIGGVAGVPSSASALGFEVDEPAPTRIVRRVGGDVQAVDVRVFTDSDTDSDDDQDTERPAGRPLATMGEGWEHLAVAADLGEVAAVGGDGLDLRRWRDGTSGAPRRFGTRLTAPAYDRTGFLWTGGLDARGHPRVWSIDTRAGGLGTRPVPVEAPWLAGHRLVTVRPAADGRRAVVVSRTPRGALRIGVAGIVRDAGGRPLRLNAPWLVGGDVLDALDVSWVDRRHLAVIGRRSSSAPFRPLVVPLGGPTTELAAVRDPRRIFTTGGERGLVVLSGDGAAHGRVGGVWDMFGTFDALAVPGR